MKQKKIRIWCRSNTGTSAIAYALLASLLSTMIIAATSSTGKSVENAFEAIADEMGDAPSPPAVQGF